jgi:hypothetical protein
VHDDHHLTALQGWHGDPFGRFEERYYAHGQPTALVRTAHVESRDEPTVIPITHATTRPVEDAGPSAAKPIVYARRPHPVAGPTILAVAVGTALVVWIVLTGGSGSRLFTGADFAVVTFATGALIWFGRRDRIDPPARRPVGFVEDAEET